MKPQRSAAAIIILATVFFPTCGPLEVSDVQFCDQFKNGVCEKPWDAEVIYRPDVPEFKTHTWHDLGYHMYFHSRETPGLRLEWNRSLTDEELRTLEASFQCEARITTARQTWRGHMEGVRVDEQGAWCFDYVGSMLVDYHKALGEERNAPDPAFFPIELTIEYSVGRDDTQTVDLSDIHGEKSGEVSVRW